MVKLAASDGAFDFIQDKYVDLFRSIWALGFSNLSTLTAGPLVDHIDDGR